MSIEIAPELRAPDVSMFRYDCFPRVVTTITKPKGGKDRTVTSTNLPGCGPDQTITNGYERSTEHMTGSTWVLVNRCGGCGQIVSASLIDVMRWQKDRDHHGSN